MKIYLGEKDKWRTYGSRRQRVGTEKINEFATLLTFWPDCKMRGQVWVRPTEKIIEKYRHIAAYDEDWIQLRETELHHEDRENLYIHCARKLDGRALIIHPIERTREQCGLSKEKTMISADGSRKCEGR